ncbi:MAG TPA: TonB-dependent receptor [Fibrobacteria bacterium]|nr:TonB-dependent receptor [Fibrobacteria bacterium]
MEKESRTAAIAAVFWIVGVASAGTVPESTQATPADSAEDGGKVFDLGITTVTGSRPNRLQRVRPVADDRASPRRDAAQIASELPGVVVSQVGPRAEQQIWIRGFDSRQTGLYLDGVPVYVPYDGNVDLARFSSAELSSVAVEKGASSLALGPNSMGGVLTLTTARPARDLEVAAELAQVGRNGQQGNLRIAGRKGDFYALGSGSFRGTGGTELASGFHATRFEDGEVRDNSASFDRTLHGKIGWKGGDGAEVAISVADQHGRKEVPVYAGTDTASSRARFWQWPYWDKTSVCLLTRIPLGSRTWLETPLFLDKFRNSLMAYDDRGYSAQKKKSSFQSWYDDWSAGGSVRIGMARQDDTAKVFVHFKDDNHHESNTTNDTAKAATKHAFLDKPDVRFEDRTFATGMEAAVALPWNLVFAPGVAWNYRIAERADNLLNPWGYNYAIASFPLESADMWDAQGILRWKPRRSWDLHGSVSYRSHFPTIKDRYSYKLGSAVPNPDLKAERSLQVEAGFVGNPTAWLSLEASLWEAWITDAIVTVSKVGPAGESQSRNAGYIRHGGPEWFGSPTSDWALPAPELAFRAKLPWQGVALARLEASGSWSYLLRRDPTNPSFRFVDQPEHRFVGSVLWSPVRSVDLVASPQGGSSRPGASSGSSSADGYVSVDALARWRIETLVLEAGMQNAFDADYALSEGYPEPGRTGFVRVGWTIR